MASLQERKKQLLAKIKEKGGKESAPGLANRLDALNKRIREQQSGQKQFNKAIDQTNQITQAGQDYGNQLVQQYLPDGSFQTVNVASAPEVQANLDALNAAAQEANQVSALEQEALAAARAGMAGYAAPELQAMREAAAGEINAQMQAALEQARIGAARNNIVGGAASAEEQDARLAAVGARGNLERDLVIQNAQEMQSRRQAFANLVRSTEDARFGRAQGARDSYTGALTSEDAAIRDRERFNVGQQQNEALAQSGLALSGAGLFSSLLSEQQANQLANKQFKWGKRRDQRIMRLNEMLANQYAQQANSLINQYQSVI